MLEAFRLPFMQYALIATSLIAALCSLLGVYIVLKRIVFVSAVLAQVSTAGLGLAFLVGLHPTVTALLLTLVAVVMFARTSFRGKIPQDSVLGISYVTAFAFGILFIARAAQGMEELQHLLQGNILTISPQQIYLLAGTAVVVGLIHYLFYKEFLFVSFDAEMAQTQGYNVKAWNFLLYFTVGLVIALGIRVAGVLLIFAFLVMPAAIALLLLRRMRGIFAMAIVIGLIAVFLGLYFSFDLDLPSGPTIVTVLFIFLLMALAFKMIKKMKSTNHAGFN
ncbi:MAG: metal ABC transporter permease [candidate division KSB1 bacterium]|nr:metal ABC transporter permease [candidate division KSB1 bacterium]MDZ7304223.1 metal ABC transporter permease [candidate division KSB1 bacterium]MDZ7311698.1 metal ABC transporter permease [candidate division KSB1 bacterium]